MSQREPCHPRFLEQIRGPRTHAKHVLTFQSLVGNSGSTVQGGFSYSRRQINNDVEVPGLTNHPLLLAPAIFIRGGCDHPEHRVGGGPDQAQLTPSSSRAKPTLAMVLIHGPELQGYLLVFAIPVVAWPHTIHPHASPSDAVQRFTGSKKDSKSASARRPP